MLFFLLTHVFVLLCLKRHFLKGMGEKHSLSEDERLTPNNGKVMATNIIHQYPHFWLFISINWKISNQLCTSLEVI